jgi:hypothetical protein
MTKAMLPFRASRDTISRHPQIVLHYDAPLPSGQTQPSRLVVGPPLDDTSAPYYRDPLGLNILKLMMQFWDLEARMESLEKERDNAVASSKTLQRDYDECQRQIERLKGQLKKTKTEA